MKNSGVWLTTELDQPGESNQSRRDLKVKDIQLSKVSHSVGVNTTAASGTVIIQILRTMKDMVGSLFTSPGIFPAQDRTQVSCMQRDSLPAEEPPGRLVDSRPHQPIGQIFSESNLFIFLLLFIYFCLYWDLESLDRENELHLGKCAES